MIEAPSIQWFPGHMTKTKRMIKASLPLVDAVVEVIDARIPAASRNPDLSSLIEDKPRIVLLNKSDSADEKATEKWLRYYKNNGIPALSADCRTGKGLNKFEPLVNEVLADLIKRSNERGMTGRVLHLMVVGIPNAGKSSFINRMAGSKKAKVEDRPGVTREKQWVKIAKNIELLDMPGVLWPKFEDKLVGEKLAFTGAVKDDVVDIETLACRLLMNLNVNYHDNLKERYKKLSDDLNEDGYELLKQVGMSRGMLISGGEINTERAAITVLDEFRSGKLGRITLELPE
ncbi:MAG: ribosome biogenesis GTPase YlqF [Oscillospiraceae bacterium]|nr:ribosome biogenesis GTPase YlqF [Oscillospiraceae bacterium]MDY2848496.1 ribosome biogenesis GTPase YlqF [Oscillospiraceae bacterium]